MLVRTSGSKPVHVATPSRQSCPHHHHRAPATLAQLSRIELIHLIHRHRHLHPRRAPDHPRGAQRELGLPGHCRCHCQLPISLQFATSVTYCCEDERDGRRPIAGTKHQKQNSGAGWRVGQLFGRSLTGWAGLRGQLASWAGSLALARGRRRSAAVGGGRRRSAALFSTSPLPLFLGVPRWTGMVESAINALS